MLKTQVIKYCMLGSHHRALGCGLIAERRPYL